MYGKSSYGHRNNSGGYRYCTGTTEGVPGGPPGGSTCPGGPYGLYVEGNQPLSGLGTIPPRAHAPRVGGEP